MNAEEAADCLVFLAEPRSRVRRPGQVIPTTYWETATFRASVPASLVQYARFCPQKIRPNYGRPYVNFLTEEEGDDRVRAACGNYEGWRG
jgi:hypothetical protein